MRKIIAIACADLHLSHDPPRARANEPNWYAVMQRQLRELDSLADEHRVPILIAGDVFDRWNCSIELLNFALEVFPSRCCVIPGQHDIPNHNYKEMHRSPFHTLLMSGLVIDLTKQVTLRAEDHITAIGFGWGCKVKPRQASIAVVHDYIYTTKTDSFPQAPKEKRIGRRKDQASLNSYRLCIFGDNHIPFEATRKDTHFINCGSFFRRTVADFPPSVILIDDELNGHRIRLRSAERDWPLIPPEERTNQESKEKEFAFLKDLQQKEGPIPDFLSLMRQAIKSNKKSSVSKILQEILDASDS